MSDEIEVRLFEGLNQSPALNLAVRGWADCVEQGFGDGVLNVYTSLNAFVGYAMNGREQLPVGVMTWEYEKATKRVWIYQSFVEIEFRGRGIYQAMWAKIVEHAAVELKAATIESATHVRNIAMRAIARKQGRFEEAVTLKFIL